MQHFSSAAITTAVLISLIGAVPARAAVLVNAGFETGDLTGWTTNGGPVSVVTSFGPYTPSDGSYFAVATAGLGADVPTTLSQTITLNAGDTISGAWGFYDADYLPFDDWGYLSVNGTNLLYADVASTGGPGSSTGWQTYSFTAPTAGVYTLQAGVANNIDNSVSSSVVLDATVAAPEPVSMAILGVGLAGLGLVRRKRG